MFPRLLTGVLGVPLVILTVYLGGVSFALLVFLVSVFACYEYLSMAKRSGYENDVFTGLLASIILPVGVFLDGKGVAARSGYPFTSLFLFIILLIFFVREFFKFDRFSLVRILVKTFGVFFISWSLLHIALIRDVHGREWCYFLIVTIWFADTFAWFIGTYFGKKRPQFIRDISPKKTLEGFFGELTGGVIGAVFIKSVVFKNSSYTQFLIMGAVIGLLSFISDLSESLIKRSFGFKDSSNLLPGHGGILDRFDSFLITAPLFYYILQFRI